jgi:DNA-binding MarR family transcriptional regulator
MSPLTAHEQYQLAVLTALEMNPLMLADIEERLQDQHFAVTSADVARLIDSMERDGRVTTYPIHVPGSSDDAVATAVQITKDGIAHLAKLREAQPVESAAQRAERIVDQYCPKNTFSVRTAILRALDLYDPNGPGATIRELVMTLIAQGFRSEEVYSALESAQQSGLIRWYIPGDRYHLTDAGRAAMASGADAAAAPQEELLRICMTGSALDAWWASLTGPAKAEVFMEYFEAIAEGNSRDENADREVAA